MTQITAQQWLLMYDPAPDGGERWRCFRTDFTDGEEQPLSRLLYDGPYWGDARSKIPNSAEVYQRSGNVTKYHMQIDRSAAPAIWGDDT